MPRQRNAFAESTAENLPVSGAEAPVRKRKKPELRIVEAARPGEAEFQAEKARSSKLYQTYNQTFDAYQREKNRKQPNAAKLAEMKTAADEAQKAFRAQKNREYDLAIQIQSGTFGVEDLSEVATAEAPVESKEKTAMRREVASDLDKYLQEREGIWEMTETYKETPIESRLENAREASEWQERLADAKGEAERTLEQDRNAAKVAGMDDPTFYNTFLARVNARILDKQTPRWMKKYLRVEQGRVNKELKNLKPAAPEVAKVKTETVRVEHEGPELTYEAPVEPSNDNAQEMERRTEERKAVQYELSAVKRTLKKLESQLSKYGEAFELTNDLARPKLGLGERFGRFLQRITGKSPDAGTYDQLIAAWKEQTAKIEPLELKLNALKRTKEATRGEAVTDEDIHQVIARKTEEERHENEKLELRNVQELMNEAVATYEKKREDGTLDMNELVAIERSLQELDERANHLMGERPPYHREATKIKHYLSNTFQIINQAKQYLNAKMEVEDSRKTEKLPPPSENAVAESEGPGSMREAVKMLEKLVAKKRELWEMTETLLNSNGGAKEKRAYREQIEELKREVEQLEAQGRAAWEERLSFGEKGFLQLQLSELRRFAEDQEAPPWMQKYLTKEISALERDVNQRAKTETPAPAAEQEVNELNPEDVGIDLSIEDIKRLVPDEIFRYNKFKQAFLEQFQVSPKDLPKKRETVARKKAEVYEKLRQALEANEGADLADVYLKRLAEYRMLEDSDPRHAKLKAALDAVANDLGISYQQAEARKENTA